MGQHAKSKTRSGSAECQMRAATSTTESRRTEDRAQEHGGYIPNVRAIPHQTKQKRKQKRNKRGRRVATKRSSDHESLVMCMCIQLRTEYFAARPSSSRRV